MTPHTTGDFLHSPFPCPLHSRSPSHIHETLGSDARALVFDPTPLTIAAISQGFQVRWEDAEIAYARKNAGAEGISELIVAWTIRYWPNGACYQKATEGGAMSDVESLSHSYFLRVLGLMQVQLHGRRCPTSNSPALGVTVRHYRA